MYFLRNKLIKYTWTSKCKLNSIKSVIFGTANKVSFLQKAIVAAITMVFPQIKFQTIATILLVKKK